MKVLTFQTAQEDRTIKCTIKQQIKRNKSIIITFNTIMRTDTRNNRLYFLL